MAMRSSVSRLPSKVLFNVPLFLSCFLLTTFSLRYCFIKDTAPTCVEALSKGRWTRNVSVEHQSLAWHPIGCMIHDYRGDDIRACLRNRSLTLVGDSIARQLYMGIANRATMYNISERVTKHADRGLHHAGIQLQFIWDPLLNRSLTYGGNLIISTGLWQARYLNESIIRYGEALQDFLSKYMPSRRIAALPVTIPISHRLVKSRRETLKSEILLQMNILLEGYERTSPLEVAWYNHHMTWEKAILFKDDGLHVRDEIADLQANFLLNQECNSVLQEHQGGPHVSCCSRSAYPIRQVMTVCILACCCLLSHVAILCGNIWLEKSRGHCGGLSDTFKAKFLTSAGTICSAVLYCFFADRTRVLQKTNKVVDQSLFIILCLLSIAMGAITTKKSAGDRLPPHPRMIPDSQILSRPQTDEWKGWMQCIILAYHYFGMSQTLWVYRIIRVLVGSYLFLTGYGHTRYFLLTSDLSISRILSTLMRLNLLSGLLAVVMNTTWDFYYFPALVSFWILIVYATLLGLSPNAHILNSATRVLLSAMAVTFVSQDGIRSRRVFSFISSVGGPQINRSEFMFRLTTDMYAPFSGMILGLLMNKYPDIFSCQYWTSTRTQARLLCAGLGLVSLLVLTTYFSFSTTLRSKQTYNHFHTYASSLPILAFVTLRNLTPALQSYHSTAFAWLGRCSLETFILQYHIWLAGDTKGLLHLGILDTHAKAYQVLISWHSWRFWLEKMVLTVVFLWLSNRVALAINDITSILFKRRTNKSTTGE